MEKARTAEESVARRHGSGENIGVPSRGVTAVFRKLRLHRQSRAAPGSGNTTGERLAISCTQLRFCTSSIDAPRVAGVGVDLNNILEPQFEQWD